MKCRYCNLELAEGIALMDDTPDFGLPDFEGQPDTRGQTFTLRSSGYIHEVLKCLQCGHSITRGDEMEKLNTNVKLPAVAAKEILDQYAMDEVIVIARSYAEEGVFHYATWGTTDQASGQAAIAGDSIASMISEQPSDYGEAARLLGSEIKSRLKELKQ